MECDKLTVQDTSTAQWIILLTRKYRSLIVLMARSMHARLLTSKATQIKSKYTSLTGKIGMMNGYQQTPTAAQWRRYNFHEGGA